MEEQQLDQLEGTIEDIIFENSDSGYVVFELSGGGTLTVVCGTLGELHVGQSVVCRGRYETHATYGRQFHATECITDMPRDLDAVYAFLASRSLPYVGPATAQKIIEKFGTASLDVIANEPARLTEIKGISADKADRIQQEFKRMFGMRELIAYLAQFEIGPRRAMEVFRTFGPGAAQAIAANPYLLCGEPLQLDFRHADSIAQPQCGQRPYLPAPGTAGGHGLGLHPSAPRKTHRRPGKLPGKRGAGLLQLEWRGLYLPARPAGGRESHCGPAGLSGPAGQAGGPPH